eukprot:Skav200833  [mRNA]  locus=scaffold3034:137231:140843:+ [translate_table: standard]
MAVRSPAPALADPTSELSVAGGIIETVLVLAADMELESEPDKTWNLTWNIMEPGYLRMKSADASTMLRRMGCGRLERCLHTRSHWSCSVAMFTCFSCLLMVWHAIVLLLMFCYDYTPDQVFAVRCLMGSSGLFVVLNWVFWRDFVRHYRETQEDEGLDFVDFYKLQLLCKMYQSKVIRSRKARDIQEEASPPLSCAICLEEFGASETVSELPCGHCFHTACINKWVLEDWRCPFRCALEMPRSLAKTQQAWPAQA